MAQVNVEIGGRSYALGCRDGDEPHLRALTADLAHRADNLVGTLGTMSEARLLLMTALMVADELHDLRIGETPAADEAAKPASAADAANDPANDPASDAMLTERLTALTARVQALTARLENKSAAA